MAITKIIQKKDPLTVILLHAGLTRRMKKGPRALLEIGGEKLIERQIRTLRFQFPHSDIVVVTGYGAESIYPILPPFVRTVENEFYETTNVIKSIALALRISITPKVLIIYGDMVFGRNTFPIQDKSTIFLDKNGKQDCVGINGNPVEHLSYVAKQKWAHSFLLQDKELAIIKSLVFNKIYEKFHGHEILNIAIEQGAEFSSVNCGTCFELDTISDITRCYLSEEKL